jgi:hypothetical protein
MFQSLKGRGIDEGLGEATKVLQSCAENCLKEREIEHTKKLHSFLVPVD